MSLIKKKERTCTNDTVGGKGLQERISGKELEERVYTYNKERK
jgi:hypothetical protein